MPEQEMTCTCRILRYVPSLLRDEHVAKDAARARDFMLRHSSPPIYKWLAIGILGVQNHVRHSSAPAVDLLQQAE